MYANLFLGEWRKIAGQRWAAITFVWIAPIAALLFLGFLIVVALFSAEFRREIAQGTVTPWNDTLLTTWLFVNNEFGRYVIAGFAAIVFAGEYQWGTWKNFVPHRRRTTLLLTKFVVFATYLLVAWVGMSLIVGIGVGILYAMAGLNYGELNGEIFRDFIGNYTLQMMLTLTAALIAAGYAALAAMFTRSTLSSFFIAIVLTVAENGILLPLFLIRQFLKVDLIGLYAYTPTYNLNNINTWVLNGEGIPLPSFENFGTNSANSLAMSLVIVVVWVVALVGLTVWRFNRQDITT